MLPHQQQMLAGPAWPTGSLEKSSEKALLRRKLLQPLVLPPASQACLAGAQGYAEEAASFLRGAPVPGVEKIPSRLDASAQAADKTPLFSPPQRPGTSGSSSSSRPRTAERSKPPIGAVAFPAHLQLRASGEAPGPLGPFASPGEALVIPLETQDAVRDLVAACSRGKAQVCDGACLTAWTLLDASAEASCQLLEPVAARRLDRTLAVEPIELVAERQGSAGAGAGDGAPLRYGEGFRLRAAGCAGLYLGHGGDADGLLWLHSPSPDTALEDLPAAAPKGTRFAAHGGELGASLLLGRPLSIRRVFSPPPSEASDSDAEDPESDVDDECESDTGEQSRRVRFQRKALPEAAASASQAAAKQGKKSPCVLLPEAARYAQEGLFSRLADQAASSFDATFLPLFAENESLC
eukprot:TRINITY_DN16839_c0_g1_i2.p1 TRINITY_DN16839_c0_g1~~TRINITY_DN16839_c0_g1_i2.p1  ORF type:complete len:408 (-),score=79.96 TRINITY_DN16839_c0_g1_i2:24-1247(-)